MRHSGALLWISAQGARASLLQNLEVCPAGCEVGRHDSNNQCGFEEHQDWAAGGAREAHQVLVHQGQRHTQSGHATGHAVKAVDWQSCFSYMCITVQVLCQHLHGCGL